MAVIPASDSTYSAAADTYTDVSGLQSLKRGAAARDPKAIRQVAQQFEAMFTSMMLKSMRDTVGKDPIFGSDQEDLFQGLYDQQLSLQLSKGKGLGLANMLIQQLQRTGHAGAAASATSPPAAASATGATQAVAPFHGPGAAALKAPASETTKANFISSILPQAQAAGTQLGVDPRNLIAQAALETNWGQSLPTGSNNLFGVKAGGGWSGASATATTTEYQDGTAVSTAATFRAYTSTGQSFQDYVALLRNNPRYAGALNTGGDAHAFAAGLQRGGYATDPDYARKVSTVAQQVAGYLGNTAGSAATAGTATLKGSAAVPITVTTSTL